MISKSIFKQCVVELFSISSDNNFSTTSASVYYLEGGGVQSNITHTNGSEEIFYTNDFQTNWYSLNPYDKILSEQVAFVEIYLVPIIPTSWIVEALMEL